MKITQIEARDLSEAWFLSLCKVLEEGYDYKIERDGSGQYIGDDVGIRIYWSSEKHPTLTADTTDGLVYYIGDYASDHEKELVFVDGKASVEYPIQDIYDMTWISSQSSISWQRYGTEITIPEKYGIARIKYKSAYQLFRLSGHTDQTIIAAFGIADTSGINIRVRVRDIPDSEILAADPISDNAITDRQGAIERGTAYIDDNRYDTIKATIKVPYFDDALPGRIAYINDDGVGISGNCYIMKQTINISMPEISANMEIVRCRV